jgi:hypothetical protein
VLSGSISSHLIKDYNILDPYIDMVEQQKIDIEEESTTTATGIKKETKEQRQQEPSKSEETQQQDNAAGAETKDPEFLKFVIRVGERKLLLNKE